MNPRGGILRAFGYINNARMIRRRTGHETDLLRLVYCFVPWWRSFHDKDILSLHSLPWLTYPAVLFLKETVRPDWKVFEFGSGASTMFFGSRCREVNSIEHDISWAERVGAALRSEGLSNCRLRYVPPAVGLARAGAYDSAFPGYEQSDFEKYVRSIDEQPDESLDLVLVDGRSREASLMHAVPKVRTGGMLILDNTERPRYQQAIVKVPKTWKRLVFPGPCAATEFFTETTIWIAGALSDDATPE